jgi:hypothetical protein
MLSISRSIDQDLSMTDPKLITSSLSRVIEENGDRVEISIYRLEDSDWTLEIIASDGASTVWEEPFDSEAAALDEALAAIKEEGIKSFFDSAAGMGGLH